jgi:NADP-dependent 3-hydroxy acid dehydrogenase YdfG
MPTQRLAGRIALVTGATSGIGRATALALAAEGAKIVAAGRRKDRLESLSQEIVGQYGAEGVGVLEMDVRDREDVREGLSHLETAGWGEIDVLVNNAGLAAGLSPLHEGLFDDWDRMIETNVSGLLSVTRMVLPGMVARGRGHVVNIGSLAGREVYPQGNVYCASKHAVHALNRAMRLDTLGKNIRVTNVEPGLVETEFSLVRFHGDAERAGRVYENLTPLTPEDVADAIVWALTRPPHVNIEEILLTPTAQASATHVHRG